MLFKLPGVVRRFIIMTGSRNSRRLIWPEIIFQVVLLSVVFMFYAFNREGGRVNLEIDEPEVMFFLSYAAAAMVINYFLLHKFLYVGKYWQFALGVAILIGLVIFTEECVIEQIYYPDTRGASFPGILNNLLGAMPTITILAGFKFAWDALTKQRQVEELKMAVKESELQYLKSQVNPHFLFNNLNNLYAYALEQSPKTTEIILELSEVLRYMLYECKEKYVPLVREVEQLGYLVNLSRLQLEDRGTVSFNVGELPAGYQIAPLLLPVFVENAFKHSMSSQTEQIEIRINISMDDSGQLHFVCENTYSAQSNTGGIEGGIGLENVMKRLELLYPGAHQLDIDEGVDQFKVSLRLKLNKI